VKLSQVRRASPQPEFEAEMNRVDEEDFFTLSQRLWTAWGQLPCAERNKHVSDQSQNIRETE